MTVIVWDGSILAADRQSTNAGLKRSVTKIKKIGDSLYGVSGSFDRAAALFNWVEEGKDPEQWPEFQRDDDACHLMEIAPGGIIYKYEREPYPIHFEENKYAQGAGRDYAMGAMYMGANAVDAVKAACEFDATCGMGIDILALDEANYLFTNKPRQPEDGGKKSAEVFSIGIDKQ